MKDGKKWAALFLALYLLRISGVCMCIAPPQHHKSAKMRCEVRYTHSHNRRNQNVLLMPITLNQLFPFHSPYAASAATNFSENCFFFHIFFDLSCLDALMWLTSYILFFIVRIIFFLSSISGIFNAKFVSKRYCMDADAWTEWVSVCINIRSAAAATMTATQMHINRKTASQTSEKKRLKGTSERACSFFFLVFLMVNDMREMCTVRYMYFMTL